MDGTYIREPDGATRLLYSEYRFRDAHAALLRFPQHFEPVSPGTDAWDSDVEREAQHLAPGEWLVIDGALMFIGG